MLGPVASGFSRKNTHLFAGSHLGSYHAADMMAFAGEFNLPRLERVVSGASTVDRLGDELDRLGVARAVLVTGRTLGGSPLLDRILRSIGERCAVVFRNARQHVPSCSVTDLTQTIEQHRADCVISFGGGSPIDTVKAALHAVLTAAGDGTAATTADLPHIAVPTTLSAGEFTSVAGVTDEKTRVKRAISDPRIAPRTVVIDPTVTLQTPGWLWAATGVRALDHAVESIYSIRHHPIGDTLAREGLTLLLEHLPPSMTDEGDVQLEHRLRCQMAAWMCVYGITNAGFGLSHALGHQIGPRWDVAHGITSCITLPHAMRFMADVASERFAPIAGAFGLPFDESSATAVALECAERMAAFIDRLGLPRRLRDVGVPRDEVGEVAGVVQEVMERAQVVGRPLSRAAIVELLAAAY